MKLNLTLATFSLLLLLASCTPPNPAQGKLKTWYSSQYHDTITYSYDAEGRLTGYAGSKGYRTSYVYSGNTITESTEGGSKVTMYLNSSGLVDSLTDVDTGRAFENSSPKPNYHVTRVFPYSGNQKLSYLGGGIASRNCASITEKLIYDSLGYLRQETEYVNGKLWSTSDVLFAGGNLDSYALKFFFADTVHQINPATLDTETKVIKLADVLCNISYAPDKPNSLAMNSFFGKCSKNLAVQKMTADSTFTFYTN